MEVVNTVLQLGGGVNHVDANMGSALMLAASTGLVHVVQALLEKGADVNLLVGARSVLTYDHVD